MLKRVVSEPDDADQTASVTFVPAEIEEMRNSREYTAPQARFRCSERGEEQFFRPRFCKWGAPRAPSQQKGGGSEPSHSGV